MWTRRAFAGIAAASAAALPAAALQAAPAGARRAEIEALRRFAETTHPRGREAAADADWRARWDALAAEADALPDGAYFLRARRALGWFKDGHTTALPFEFIGGVPAPLQHGPFGLELPIRVRVFHDGAWIVAGEHAGARIERIGALSAIELVRAHALHFPGSDVWAHRWAGEVFSSPALLHALGAVRDPSQSMQVLIAQGARTRTVTLRPRAAGVANYAPVARTRAAQEEWAEAAGFGNYARALPEHAALYLSIDDMDDVEGKTFVDFTREAFAAMEAPASRKLILDVRRNGGGNNFWPEALRKRIARTAFNRPGGLYVLTSPMTFSAAQNPTTRLERDTFAIFVGEPTGGAPNHYGDARPFTGAATGIVSIVATLPWFDSYPQDTRDWIMPDLFAPMNFADWRAGRDPALAAALAHQTDEAPDELARERIFFYERPSQQEPWRPFWRAQA